MISSTRLWTSTLSIVAVFVFAASSATATTTMNIDFGPNGAKVCGSQKATITTTITFDPSDCSSDLQYGYAGQPDNIDPVKITCNPSSPDSLTQHFTKTINEPMQDFYGYLMIKDFTGTNLDAILNGDVPYDNTQSNNATFITNRGGTQFPPSVKDTIFGC